uniref:Uncharacterized protein n=1 Tax=viral metagenome TaxID=1070528 RepID=A0A6C0J6C3_9ZZZZ
MSYYLPSNITIVNDKVNDEVYKFNDNSPLDHDWYFKISISSVICCDEYGELDNHGLSGSDIMKLKTLYGRLCVSKSTGAVILAKIPSVNKNSILWTIARKPYSTFISYIEGGVDKESKLLLLYNIFIDPKTNKDDVFNKFKDLYGQKLKHYQQFLDLNFN